MPSVPSSRPKDRINDVISNIDKIGGYTAGLDLDGYMAAPGMVRDAVERCFQRISEAAVKLGSDLDARYPNAGWRQARSIGNVLRHDYDEIENPTIWFAIIQDLPKLRAAAVAELARLAAAELSAAALPPRDQ
jgi:uncharacterized protein with HEPN domain